MKPVLSADEAHRKAAIDMVNVERKIGNLTRWRTPAPDTIEARVLAALLAKRTRDRVTLAALKIAADAAPPPARSFAVYNRDDKPKPRPAGTGTLSDPGPIPDFLRRVAP